jgi:hypothetical protein
VRQILREAARRAILFSALLIATAGPVGAQTPTGWNVGTYPVLLWLPSGVEIDLELPPDDGGDLGSIVESRFDGARLLRRILATKGWFRTDVDMVWAAVGGDRVDSVESLTPVASAPW